MLTRLFGTSGFQIAVFYLVLLSLTLLALSGFIYWSTANLIDRQVKETVEAEVLGLAEQYFNEGLPRLVEVISERSSNRANRQSVYVLANAGRVPMAGNLAKWPDAEPGPDGWLEVELRRLDEDNGAPHVIRGRAFELAGGYHLFVGRDAEERGDFRRIMVTSLAWALIPALLLGLVGGLLIGRYTLRRVDVVRETSEDIVGGDLSRRVPLTGSNDEFDRLAQTINRMLDRIDTLMTGMRTVTDSLAHDLRSPLTRIKSGIEQALRHETDTDSYRQVLADAGAELETIERTFEALINIAQVEAGTPGLALSQLDLSALVGDIVEIYQPMAEDAGLQLDASIAPGIVADGHRQLLGQAIANLLDNAIKFTPSGGRVAVSLRRADASIVLAVDDTGPGIPAADRGRVLERFVRLDTSRGTPGSGLGLSLVAAVANLHGAALTLDDNVPGLSVRLTFPSG